jgi:alanyl-tRNA synthetase
MTAGATKTGLTYLRDMQLRQLEADAMRVVPEKGSHAYLILDRTIFHPKGGGQPSDRGTISSPAFTVTVKKAIFHHGVVAHWAKIVNGTPSPSPVTCQLDWPYRYLVMRRHTAAHLLDHCLATVTSNHVETTDSWLDEPCYVGYGGKPPAPETLKQVEDLANHMISTGAAVRIQFLTPEEGRALLQNAPNFERLPDLDEVRTVTITSCNPIPCGGTHVQDIKEIGKLSIARAEQVSETGYRVYFSV